MKKILLIAFTILITACTQEEQNSLNVHDAWVRAAPPNATAMAGYLTINNPSQLDYTLISANSPQFNKVEFHRTVITDGVARMRRQDELNIPAGNSLTLKPGDFHLMLLTPKAPLHIDDQVSVTLSIKNSDGIEEIMITMPVKKP